MDRYTVLSALDHDQVAYAAGAVVDLAPVHADPLLACGCIAELPDEPASEATDEPAVRKAVRKPKAG